MAKTEAVEAPENPVDLTEELPLDDENVLAAEPPSMWRRYRWPIVGLVVVLIAGAVGLTLWLTWSSTPATGLTVTTATVSATTGTIQQTVASSGTLEPASQATLNFAVSGTVTGVNVKAGQTVTAGQVLATVDTTALYEEVTAAQAQLTAAEDRLDSDEASDASTSTIDSDQASVTSAESSLSTAQTNLNDASLTSTICGTVASVGLTTGQQVTGTGSGRRHRAKQCSVERGQRAQTRVAAGRARRPARSWSSARTRTSSTPPSTTPKSARSQTAIRSTSPRAATPRPSSARWDRSASSARELRRDHLPSRDRRDGNPTGLYAGATADVSIIVKQLNNVTEVPTGAISYGTNGQATVTKVVNGSHVVTNVTVGAAENGETQITSGVKSGDKVLEREITFKAPGGGAAVSSAAAPGRRGASAAEPGVRRGRCRWLHRRRWLHRWGGRRRRTGDDDHSPAGDPPRAGQR